MGIQPLSQKWRSPPIFGPRLLWPNGCMDQDATGYGGRPRPTRHCVRWGLNSPYPKAAQPPIFGQYSLRPKGLMDYDTTWYGGRPRPRRLCVRWRPSCPIKRAHLPLPNFWPRSVVAKRLDGSRCHLVWRYGRLATIDTNRKLGVEPFFPF